MLNQARNENGQGKITRLTAKPEILASTITAEKVRRWLEKKDLKAVVIERPSLLTEEEKEELEKLIGSKNIYTYETVEIEEEA